MRPSRRPISTVRGGFRLPPRKTPPPRGGSRASGEAAGSLADGTSTGGRPGLARSRRGAPQRRRNRRPCARGYGGSVPRRLVASRAVAGRRAASVDVEPDDEGVRGGAVSGFGSTTKPTGPPAPPSNASPLAIASATMASTSAASERGQILVTFRNYDSAPREGSAWAAPRKGARRGTGTDWRTA